MAIDTEKKVLVTLRDGHTYVSPSWHESSGVPTWNYQAVHVEGVAQNFTDSEKLEHVLGTSTKANESADKSLGARLRNLNAKRHRRHRDCDYLNTM